LVSDFVGVLDELDEPDELLSLFVSVFVDEEDEELDELELLPLDLLLLP
jgi:hypothetical protein